MNAARKLNSLLSSGTVSVTTGSTQSRLLKAQQKTVYVQKGECYVCDEPIGENGALVAQSFTSVSHTKIPTKIGRILGDAFVVIINVDDVICKRCLAMFNEMDRLENDLDRVKANILGLMNNKYDIWDGSGASSNSVDAKPPPTKVQRLSGGTVQYANRKTSNGGDTEIMTATRKIAAVPTLQPIQTSTAQGRVLAVSGGTNAESIDGQILIDQLEQQQNSFGQQQQTIQITRQTIQTPTAAPQKKPIKIYKCMSCEFKTTDLKQFQPHYETCRQQNGYRCKICKKIFNNANALKVHTAEKHASDYTCSICSISYSNEAIFKKHMETNHPDVKTVETNTTAIAGKYHYK